MDQLGWSTPAALLASVLLYRLCRRDAGGFELDRVHPTICYESPRVAVWTAEGNHYGTRTYLYVDRAAASGVLVDASGGAAAWRAAAEAAGVTIRSVLLTHAHFDHIYAVADWAPLPVHLHAGDERQYALHGMPLAAGVPLAPWVARAMAVGTGARLARGPPTRPLVDGEALPVGAGRRLRVVHVPGHSPGSCVFLDEQEGVAFTGDFLFRRSVGRTDLGEASPRAMVGSLRRFAATADAARATLHLFPGHGASTTWAEERRHNPHVRAALAAHSP